MVFKYTHIWFLNIISPNLYLEPWYMLELYMLTHCRTCLLLSYKGKDFVFYKFTRFNLVQ